MGRFKAPDSSLEPHFPQWRQMFVIYHDVAPWVGALETFLIRQTPIWFPTGDAKRVFVLNHTQGGEGTNHERHMFCYVLS